MQICRSVLARPPPPEREPTGCHRSKVGDAQAWTESRQDKRCKFACLETRRRRHLNESQRAVIAARLANIRRDEFRGNQYKKVDSINLDYSPISLEQAAELLNVGRAMIAAKLANMRRGERTDLKPSANLQKVSQETAADYHPTGAWRQHKAHRTPHKARFAHAGSFYTSNRRKAPYGRPESNSKSVKSENRSD